ncbi:hypothetical protein [Candidatus Albibeggiatoa sp. nov. NOAA]|uniref:hypothetical protein n=1 Tax=Candidatus Albibeggiatoa sp. nov. NOAA TaxID=3162724 RepID=UPI003304DA4F|nr:hypothetical protein [Thiotrichaceae bacterium]
MLKKWLFVLMLSPIVGCSSVNSVVQKLDSSGWDDKTHYDKAETLPPLKVDPDLISPES